jgi:hypothetical protein
MIELLGVTVTPVTPPSETGEELPLGVTETSPLGMDIPIPTGAAVGPVTVTDVVRVTVTTGLLIRTFVLLVVMGTVTTFFNVVWTGAGFGAGVGLTIPPGAARAKSPSGSFRFSGSSPVYKYG